MRAPLDHPAAVRAPLESGGPPGAELLEAAVQQLRSTHLFAALPPSALAALAGSCERRSLAAGDVLLRQGDAGDAFFVVLAGRLRATQRTDDGRDLVLGEAHRGEHLGEAALLDVGLRLATVTAMTEALVLRLSRDVLLEVLEHHPDVRDAILGSLQQRIRWAATRRLRPSPAEVSRALAAFVGGLDEGALSALGDEVEWTALPRGSLLMTQGEPGECLYVVVSGRIAVFAHRDDGSELPIAEIGPGESVGEMALLSSDARVASARVLRDAELLRLSRAGFDRLISGHPRTMRVFTRIIVERLNRRMRGRALVTQLRTTPPVSPEECQEVTRVDDLVLRNLKITQMYYRLSIELTLLLGHQDANWCTFACNASKTAGYSIRREEMPLYHLVQQLRESPRLAGLLDAGEQRVGRTRVAARVSAVLGSVSEAISAGNLKVYAELAPVFADLIRTFHQDPGYDHEKLARFVGRLRPGPTEAGGQDTLAEALSHYYEAMFERDQKRRSELILLGNIKVGLHEQTRLQPNIVEALGAPLRLGLGGLLGDAVVERAGALLPRSVAQHVHARLDRVEARLVGLATEVWRRLVTRSVMTLRLPYGSVRLGADVPKLPHDRDFPDVLQTLEHPEVVQLVQRYDRDVASLERSRAADWGNLEDRMNFIVNLFRSRQQSLELFDQPFLLVQRLDMARGRVPHGQL